MKVDEKLVTYIAQSAISEPYRQIDTLDTRRFVNLLKARGIDVGDWRVLHHLWAIGVLHPIAVLNDALTATPCLLDSSERFIEVDLGLAEPAFVDTGTDVPEDALLLPSAWDQYPGHLQETLFWHPFQLWAFEHLEHWIIRVSTSWSGKLQDPARLKDPSRTWRYRRKALLAFAGEERYHSFLRLLALLLRVEPYVHLRINSVIRLPGPEDGYEYFTWRDAQPCASALSNVGLTVEEAEQWHAELSRRAKFIDPLLAFRKLMRHADRDQRKRLKGMALLAHDLYDQAETLRRYLEQYHGRQLLEEDDVGAGPGIARIHQANYGSPRPGDFDRRVFRRIARSFGVDPQARTVYFVEGATEEGFIEHWADMLGVDLHTESVQIVNLEGKDAVRNALFNTILQRLQDDEIFPIIALDEDRHNRANATYDHVGKLRELRKSGLLPLSQYIWRPNFVARNFTEGELVRIAKEEAARRNIDLLITAKEVKSELRSRNATAKQEKDIWTIEDALFKVANKRANTLLLEKGKKWGTLLADWAMQISPPKTVQDERGNRPILTLCNMLLRAKSADYNLSVEISRGLRPHPRQRNRAD